MTHAASNDSRYWYDWVLDNLWRVCYSKMCALPPLNQQSDHILYRFGSPHSPSNIAVSLTLFFDIQLISDVVKLSYFNPLFVVISLLRHCHCFCIFFRESATPREISLSTNKENQPPCKKKRLSELTVDYICFFAKQRPESITNAFQQCNWAVVCCLCWFLLSRQNRDERSKKGWARKVLIAKENI